MVSHGYSPVKGTLLTRSSLVRHYGIATTVRLACLKHAASVRPEPESNSNVLRKCVNIFEKHMAGVSRSAPTCHIVLIFFCSNKITFVACVEFLNILFSIKIDKNKKLTFLYTCTNVLSIKLSKNNFCAHLSSSPKRSSCAQNSILPYMRKDVKGFI